MAKSCALWLNAVHPQLIDVHQASVWLNALHQALIWVNAVYQASMCMAVHHASVWFMVMAYTHSVKLIVPLVLYIMQHLYFTMLLFQIYYETLSH